MRKVYHTILVSKKDIEENRSYSLAVGNPCKINKELKRNLKPDWVQTGHK
jgi:hypothetical protein